MIEGHDYTIYSGGPGGRSRMYALLALIIAFFTPVAQHGILVFVERFWGEGWDPAELARFFGGFTALVLFGCLINIFNSHLWKMQIGRLLFRVAGLVPPPELTGEYRGEIELRSAVDPEAVFRTGYLMRIVQTWEQISVLVERASENGGHVHVHSDMASISVGMMAGTVTLRFVYTFEENIPRRQGSGMMSQQFSGAANLQFSRDGDLWSVEGHFFDDIGRSGQLLLRQVQLGSLSSDHSMSQITDASEIPNSR